MKADLKLALVDSRKETFHIFYCFDKIIITYLLLCYLKLHVSQCFYVIDFNKFPVIHRCGDVLNAIHLHKGGYTITTI